MRRFLFLVVLVGWSCVGWTQSRSISGQVTTAKENETIPGVNIFVKGTTQGTITDMDGRFTLTVPSEESILVFSYIGYLTQEMNVSGMSTLDVALEENATELNEVI